jgi:hypothetical protein
MNLSRLTSLCATFVLLASVGCSKPLAENGTFTTSSASATATGEYKRVDIDSVERMSIEDGKLVLHGTGGSLTLDLPANADPDQKNRGWALVTEGEGDGSRTFTFTQETTLEDFSVTVPAAAGRVAYGSLGGRDGRDVVVFAYGSGNKAYWAWANIEKKGNRN